MNPIRLPPGIICPSCNGSLTAGTAQIIDYFNSRTARCGKCRAEIDWWKACCSALEQNLMDNQAFSLVGAETLVFQLRLVAAQSHTFRFSDYGIPRDARILYINYTPEYGLFPLEMHGNIPTRRIVKDQVTLYPVPLGNGGTEETKVNVMVSWVPASNADDSWLSLVDAFEAFAQKKYSLMIVPANVAVESTLSRVMTGYLQRIVSKQRVNEFLENAATYGHQLNVILPVIARLRSLPMLPDHVRGALNRLRDLRNQLAHSGVLDDPIDLKSAAAVLCGALFGMQYVLHIETLLEED